MTFIITMMTKTSNWTPNWICIWNLQFKKVLVQANETDTHLSEEQKRFLVYKADSEEERTCCQIKSTFEETCFEIIIKVYRSYISSTCKPMIRLKNT